IVGHLGDRRDPHFYLPIAERGCFLGIDNVGCVEFQREEQRARTVLALIRAGHLSQLLLSHDICTLADLKWYGGKGFDYVLVVFVPLLRSLGVTDEEIHALLVDNPRRALAFSAPSAAARRAGDRGAHPARPPRFRPRAVHTARGRPYARGRARLGAGGPLVLESG